MLTTIEATYDGQVIKPDVPLKLEANTRVTITIDSTESKPILAKRSFLDVARSLDLDCPPTYFEDWENQPHGSDDPSA